MPPPLWSGRAIAVDVNATDSVHSPVFERFIVTGPMVHNHVVTGLVQNEVCPGAAAAVGTVPAGRDPGTIFLVQEYVQGFFEDSGLGKFDLAGKIGRNRLAEQ